MHPCSTVSKFRVLLVPITRNCYALHSNTLYKSLSATKKPSNAHYLQVEYIPILNDIKSVRTRKWINSQLNHLHNFWLDCELKSETAPKSMRGRLYKATETVLLRVDGTESFLGSIPYKPLTHRSEEVNLLYIIPNGLNEHNAMNHLRAVSNERHGFHKKMLFLSICWLPLTFLLGILPGPNVFFYYNAFRCFSHYRAWHGAIALNQNINGFEVVADECLNEIYNDLQEETKKATDDAFLHQLQLKFDCEHILHHLHRVRYQILELGKHERYNLLKKEIVP